MFSEIDHVGITTDDLEKHLYLFRDTLGLNVLSDFEVSGWEWEKDTGIKGVKLKRIELQKNNISEGKFILLKFYFPKNQPFIPNKKS